MKIKYKLASPANTIAGTFLPGEVKDVPDEIGKALLKCQGFESPKVKKKKEEIKDGIRTEVFEVGTRKQLSKRIG